MKKVFLKKGKVDLFLLGKVMFKNIKLFYLMKSIFFIFFYNNISPLKKYEEKSLENKNWKEFSEKIIKNKVIRNSSVFFHVFIIC